ncbi:DUF4190 domain-containing protein [Streptomyces sp. NPDC058001]|uniref:DUF4190 domain-containing protein n=1 Tax=Streptomyces sp. NPDC058001 TaxID=3346300 RepID=UPI0036E23C21
MPQQPPPPLNGFAITSLVFGILCCLPLVGLILGIVALARIKKTGERGKPMAITGMVLSGAGSLLMVLMLATGGVGAFVDGFREGFEDAARDSVTFSVAKGECFNTPDGSLEGVTYDVETVSCEGKHDGEVFANFSMPKGSYPGDERITDTADEKCYALMPTYAMDAWAVPEYAEVYYFTPTRDSWSFGDREITCLFGNTDAGAQLTGSLRNDETTLDPDQAAYLKAARVLNTALDSAPEEVYVEKDLPGHKKWATRVADALDKQAGMLRDHDWPSDSAGPVAALIRDLDAARKEWERAAKASDADTFYVHYDKGAALIDNKKTVPVREALSLETTPPSDGANGDTGGGSGGGSGSGGSGGGSGDAVDPGAGADV